MSDDRIVIGILSVAISLSMMGCERKAPSGEQHADGTTQATTGKAHEPAPSKPSTSLTKGELSYGKLEVAYTIALPPGIKAVDDAAGRGMISYRKGRNDFDGYNVAIAVGRSKKGTLAAEKAAMLAELERQKATKKAKVLEQGDWDGGGWYLAATFEEGGKPRVTMMSRVVKGDTVLMCRGDGEGAVARAPAATAKVLIETCKSLVITSP